MPKPEVYPQLEAFGIRPADVKAVRWGEGGRQGEGGEGRGVEGREKRQARARSVPVPRPARETCCPARPARPPPRRAAAARRGAGDGCCVWGMGGCVGGGWVLRGVQPGVDAPVPPRRPLGQHQARAPHRPLRSLLPAWAQPSPPFSSCPGPPGPARLRRPQPPFLATCPHTPPPRPRLLVQTQLHRALLRSRRLPCCLHRSTAGEPCCRATPASHPPAAAHPWWAARAGPEGPSGCARRGRGTRMWRGPGQGPAGAGGVSGWGW